MGKEEATGGC